MALVVKDYERLDPGHKGTKIHIVMNNVAFFAPYCPPETKGEVLPGVTVVVMNCGAPMLIKCEPKDFKAVFATARN